MNWKPASDTAGIKPDVWYAVKRRVVDNKEYIVNKLVYGRYLLNTIERDPNTIAYAEVTTENDMESKQEINQLREDNLTISAINAELVNGNEWLRKENEQLKNESHINWKPLEGLTEWPKAGEGEMIVTYNHYTRTTDGVITISCIDTPQLRRKQFYEYYAIVNLPPAPERKLKPCRWCNAIPRAIINQLNDGHIKYYHITHAEDCPIRNITHISPADADKWGRE
jgi:hypothetical protein